MSLAKSIVSEDRAAIEELHKVYRLQKEAFLANMNPSLETRLELLGALEGMMVKYHQKIIEALKQDFKTHPYQLTMLTDVFGVLGRIAHVRAHLKDWMQPSPRELDPAFFGSSKAYVRYQPLGVVANISPWNFPFDISFGPLVDILAAGNRCMIKPSDLCPASSALIKEMVKATFAEDQVAVCVGGLELAEAFAAMPWNHIMYTGNSEVAKKIANVAAKNLIPLTLELGGKNPTIVAEDSINAETVQKIIGTKALKNGQVCVTVDYVLVPQNKVDAFVSLIEDFMSKNLPDYAQGVKIPGVINERHFDRLAGYVKDARDKNAKVIELNKDQNPVDRKKCQMPLTLILSPQDDMLVMQHEIFGPILPIKGYKTIEEAIQYVNNRERPLGTYVFTSDENIADKVLKNTISGGFAINSVAFQAAIPSLPFGGVGYSGMGCHHGFEGFKNFSHARGVFEAKEGGIASAFYPPYGELADQVIAAALGGGK